jgi:hypothetical protein
VVKQGNGAVFPKLKEPGKLKVDRSERENVIDKHGTGA